MSKEVDALIDVLGDGERESTRARVDHQRAGAGSDGRGGPGGPVGGDGYGVGDQPRFGEPGSVGGEPDLVPAVRSPPARHDQRQPADRRPGERGCVPGDSTEHGGDRIDRIQRGSRNQDWLTAEVA